MRDVLAGELIGRIEIMETKMDEAEAGYDPTDLNVVATVIYGPGPTMQPLEQRQAAIRDVYRRAVAAAARNGIGREEIIAAINNSFRMES